MNFERQLRGEHEAAARESRELSLEQQQRDVYETHRHRVFSVGYYMTSNEIEAEGILESAFVQAFRAAPVPNAKEVDRALLRELEHRLNLAPAPLATPDQGDVIHGGQVRRTDLEEALTVLPPLERLVFLLRDVEGYAADRIAELLRRDETDVQRVLLSARIRMRNAIAHAKRERSQDAKAG